MKKKSHRSPEGSLLAYVFMCMYAYVCMRYLLKGDAQEGRKATGHSLLGSLQGWLQCTLVLQRLTVPQLTSVILHAQGLDHSTFG